jgi:hypothetical protein
VKRITFQCVLHDGPPTIDWDAWIENDADPFTDEFWEAAKKAVRCSMEGDDIGCQMYLAPFRWVMR